MGFSQTSSYAWQTICNAPGGRIGSDGLASVLQRYETAFNIGLCKSDEVREKLAGGPAKKVRLMVSVKGYANRGQAQDLTDKIYCRDLYGQD